MILMKPKQDAFAALRYRDFSIITVNQFCLTLAILIQEIIVAYSLYPITQDPLTLGLIGLAEAIPFISLSLWGGYVADRFNKQLIMKICLFFSFPLPLVLWGLFHLYGLGQIGADNQFHERRFKIADLIVNVFTFLKSNMVAEQPVPPAI